MIEEERLCDQEDCEYYFYPKTIKETKIEEKNSQLIQMSMPYNGSITGPAGNYIGPLYGSTAALSASAMMSSTIDVNSFSKSVMMTNIKCLEVSIQIECLACCHFKKCDMNVISKVFRARQALLGKQ